VICLEQSLTNRHNEIQRSWWGTIGGMVAWIFIDLSIWLGGQSMTNQTSILSLMFFCLVVSVLWRRVGSLGLRYFMVILSVSWVSSVILESIQFLRRYQVALDTVYNGLGYLAGVIVLGAAWMILFRAQTRQERLNGAIVVWCAVMIIIYIFRGGWI
jgi:hypothetical protein